MDPHFRAKFADRARVPPGRGAVATSGRQARGRFQLGEEEEEDEEVEGGEEGEAVDDDDDDDDEDEDDAVDDMPDGKEATLPRTTSQLTMLLARDRRAESKGTRRGAGAQRREGGRRGGGS